MAVYSMTSYASAGAGLPADAAGAAVPEVVGRDALGQRPLPRPVAAPARRTARPRTPVARPGRRRPAPGKVDASPPAAGGTTPGRSRGQSSSTASRVWTPWCATGSPGARADRPRSPAVVPRRARRGSLDEPRLAAARAALAALREGARSARARLAAVLPRARVSPAHARGAKAEPMVPGSSAVAAALRRALARGTAGERRDPNPCPRRRSRSAALTEPPFA